MRRRGGAATLVATTALVLSGLGCGGAARPPEHALAPAADAAVDAPSPVPGEARDGLWFPTADDVGTRIALLAGPALRGRGSGTPDELAAAERLATWFRDAGLEPGGDDGGWLQRFPIAELGTSQNVIGVIRGRDPGAGHVVVGAHYDHLGHDGATIYPGADDNASGAAALVAIAQALTHDGQRPTRTVVIVAFGAEEVGLFGSAHYAAHPRLPLAAAALMINLDMVGRASFLAARDYALAKALVPDDAIGALTSPASRDLALLAKAAGTREGRPVVAASDLGPLEALIRPVVEYRGDHKSFADHGVRYLWLSTSMHDDYHLPSDTVDQVDPHTVVTVGRIVVRVVATLP